jgi:hypothetical protein
MVDRMAVEYTRMESNAETGVIQSGAPHAHGNRNLRGRGIAVRRSAAQFWERAVRAAPVRSTRAPIWSNPSVKIKFGEVNATLANSSDTVAVIQPSRPPSKEKTGGDRRQKDRDDKAPDGRTSAWSDRRYVTIR